MYRWARSSVPAVIDEEIQEDEAVVVKFFFENMAYIASWLLRYGSSAEVLEPDELKYIIRDKAMEVAGQYA